MVAAVSLLQVRIGDWSRCINCSATSLMFDVAMRKSWGRIIRLSCNL